MANIWDAEWEVSEELARRLISRQFPQFSYAHIQVLGYGWDNTVFCVGDEYVFRFPRRKIVIDLMQVEGKVLPEIETYVTLPYPKPIYYGMADNNFPAPFLGSRYIPGDFPLGLTDEQRMKSSHILAMFLKRLHSFPLQDAIALGVPRDHRNLLNVKARKEKMMQLLNDLQPHLTVELRNKIEQFLLLITFDQAQPQETFLHGDLHFKNILVDRSGQISGIIDWGDMNIGHPACDLSVAYSFLPLHARQTFFEIYGDVTEETKILARLIAVFIPMLIMLQAVDTNDFTVLATAQETIERAIANE